MSTMGLCFYFHLGGGIYLFKRYFLGDVKSSFRKKDKLFRISLELLLSQWNYMTAVVYIGIIWQYEITWDQIDREMVLKLFYVYNHINNVYIEYHSFHLFCTYRGDNHHFVCGHTNNIILIQRYIRKLDIINSIYWLHRKEITTDLVIRKPNLGLKSLSLLFN